MGLPSVITTDQGKEFNNQLNTELMTILNIKHRLTTAYHPQANGLDERYNQTLVNSLAKCVQDNREKWDESLEAVVYSYNSAVQVRLLSTFTELWLLIFIFRNQQSFLPLKLCLGERQGYLLTLTLVNKLTHK